MSMVNNQNRTSMSFVFHSEVVANRSQTHAFREAVNGLGN